MKNSLIISTSSSVALCVLCYAYFFNNALRINDKYFAIALLFLAISALRMMKKINIPFGIEMITNIILMALALVNINPVTEKLWFFGRKEDEHFLSLILLLDIILLVSATISSIRLISLKLSKGSEIQ
jgi:hypothetical protein